MAFKMCCGLEIFSHSGFRPSLPPRTKSSTTLRKPYLTRPTLLRPSLPARANTYYAVQVFSQCFVNALYIYSS